jgi:hypothetical protein
MNKQLRTGGWLVPSLVSAWAGGEVMRVEVNARNLRRVVGPSGWLSGLVGAGAGGAGGGGDGGGVAGVL